MFFRSLILTLLITNVALSQVEQERTLNRGNANVTNRFRANYFNFDPLTSVSGGINSASRGDHKYTTSDHLHFYNGSEWHRYLDDLDLANINQSIQTNNTGTVNYTNTTSQSFSHDFDRVVVGLATVQQPYSNTYAEIVFATGSVTVNRTNTNTTAVLIEEATASYIRNSTNNIQIDSTLSYPIPQIVYNDKIIYANTKVHFGPINNSSIEINFTQNRDVVVNFLEAELIVDVTDTYSTTYNHSFSTNIGILSLGVFMDTGETFIPEVYYPTIDTLTIINYSSRPVRYLFYNVSTQSLGLLDLTYLRVDNSNSYLSSTLGHTNLNWIGKTVNSTTLNILAHNTSNLLSTLDDLDVVSSIYDTPTTINFDSSKDLLLNPVVGNIIRFATLIQFNENYVGKHINLYGDLYGISIDPYTFRFDSDYSYKWYSDTSGVLLSLTEPGDLHAYGHITGTGVTSNSYFEINNEVEEDKILFGRYSKIRQETDGLGLVIPRYFTFYDYSTPTTPQFIFDLDLKSVFLGSGSTIYSQKYGYYPYTYADINDLVNELDDNESALWQPSGSPISYYTIKQDGSLYYSPLIAYADAVSDGLSNYYPVPFIIDGDPYLVHAEIIYP